MIIDLTDLIVLNVQNISIDDDVVIDDEYLKDTSIKRFHSIHFLGNIDRLLDGDFEITGEVSGSMILADDVTLEDVDYDFHIGIEEAFSDVLNDNKLQIIQNKLDITEFLWQNILLEVPSKIRKDSSNVRLEGDGWRVITEDEFYRDNESPFSELSKMFDSGKE